MNDLKCDVCQADITSAVNQRDYTHIAHRELCEACWETLNTVIRPILRTKQPFTYEWYDRLVMDTIETAMAKGKWGIR
ncbi:MAG: hypothetical protein LBG84_05835 [Treponema sp.]|jgi:ATP sulfurylase|nr:hypothetical protein [Treponema sp.]